MGRKTLVSEKRVMWELMTKIGQKNFNLQVISMNCICYKGHSFQLKRGERIKAKPNRRK